MSVSFDNTQIAFSSQSDSNLRRSYWLFMLVSSPIFVSIGKWLTTIALAIHFPIKWIIKPTIFKQFCGGETVEESRKKLEELARFNIKSVLDYSAEGKKSEKDFENCAQEMVSIILEAKQNKNIGFAVFKPSGLGRFALLEMMRSYNKEKAIVFNTFQMYRKDRLEYLIDCFLHAKKENYFLGAKLVRGAYMEKERARAEKLNYPSPINSTKEATSSLYDGAIRFCMTHLDRIAFCAGTHNEKSSMLVVQLMKEKKFPANHPHIYFSQLLGMSDHISYNLASAGYNVSKYVPYGPVRDVIPYLIRRAQENTSVKGQTGRELSLILKERERRKNT